MLGFFKEKGRENGRKSFSDEQIIGKLREAKVLSTKENTAGQASRRMAPGHKVKSMEVLDGGNKVFNSSWNQ